MPADDRSPAHPATWARWGPAITWLLVGVGGWVALDTALDGRDGRAAAVTAVVAGSVWLVVFVASLVPSTVSLTAIRWCSPLAVVAAVVALAADAEPWAAGVTLVAAVGHTALAAAAEVGRAYAQASAYGDEDRLPLRLPASFTIPLAITWVVWASVLTAAVLTGAGGRWWVGGSLGALIALATVAILPRVHRLSKRWFVVLPAGLVVHDPVVLGETLMVSRLNVRGVALALADTEAADLTGPAGGHAIEVRVAEMVTALVPPSRQHPAGRAMHVQSFLVAPSRPGLALASVARRGHPVG